MNKLIIISLLSFSLMKHLARNHCFTTSCAIKIFHSINSVQGCLSRSCFHFYSIFHNKIYRTENRLSSRTLIKFELLQLNWKLEANGKHILVLEISLILNIINLFRSTTSISEEHLQDILLNRRPIWQKVSGFSDSYPLATHFQRFSAPFIVGFQ